ncbi:MAG TPA: peptidylprolyl isomerase [Rhodocyclaceae bacterium]
MEQVLVFHKQHPDWITVNGERISEDIIAATAEDEYAGAPNPREAATRALVVHTLLRQRAAALQIEAENLEDALEQLLEQELALQTVADEEVQRYFEANREIFRSGDLFQVRHILFDTVNGENRDAKLREAEDALIQLKQDPEEFVRVAAAASTCPSGKDGGQLGQLSQGSVVPEFWAALANHGKTGLLPHLVETRFGHHIILIEHCAISEPLPFEVVQAKIRQFLTARMEQISYQQYVAQLIANAKITGIDLH